MRIDPETLRRVQAQANLPVYPAPLETDTGTQHYTDAESVELMAASRTVRNAPKTNVQSEPVQGTPVGAWILLCLLVIVFGSVAAWAFVH